MDIGNNTGIDESHRQIFWGGCRGVVTTKKICIPQELFVPQQKYFAPPPPPKKKRLQTGSLPEKATP